MRRFLSLFMMLLLALRGLAGDVMAMESPAAMVASTAAMHMSHNMDDSDSHAHHEHAEHSNHAAVEAPQCNATDSSGCGSHDGNHCTTCGLCHSAMGQSSISIFAGSSPATSQAPHGADHFASIAPAAQIKPPISAV